MNPFVLRPSSFILATALAVSAVSAVAETVEIRSAADWDNFATRVNNGETSLDAVLVRDVTLSPSSPRCGITEARYYRGSFNGNGKTLTVNWTLTNAGSSTPAAPFAYAGKAFGNGGNTIHDLRVAGSIRTDGKFAAGIVGYVVSGGRVLLTRCRSSIEITCTINGDSTSAGFAGCLGANGDVFLTDCLFDGALLGPSAKSCGGFVGWRTGSSYAKVINCLFAPQTVTFSANNSFTLVRGSDGGFYYSSHLTNGWYTQTLGTAQGNDGSGKTAAELAAALGSNWAVKDGRAVPVFRGSFDDSFRDPSVGTASFTYQGALRDAQGNSPGAGAHTVALRLYDQPAGGSPHWGRSFPVLIDENGFFNIRVGDGSGEEIGGVTGVGLANVISANEASTLYVGLAVDGETAEIMPRQTLLTVPFAAWAADAARTSGDMRVAGAATAARTVVAGGLSASSAFSTGAATAGSLAIAGRATIPGDLTVAGAVNGGGTIPIGGIVVWSGEVTDIPKGWALCNGQRVNGLKTPDLRGRFVPGAGGGYRAGTTGGEERHTLTESEMPSHRHSYTFTGADLDLSWKDHNYFYDASGHYSNNDNEMYTDYTGGGQPHENRPPYYALCYIMRVR